MATAVCLSAVPSAAAGGFVAVTWGDDSVHFLNSALTDSGSFATSIGLPNGVATDGHLIWVGSFTSTDVVAYNYAGVEQFRWSLPASAAVQGFDYLGGGRLLAMDATRTSLLTLDALNGTLLGSVPARSDSTEAIAIDGANVWQLTDSRIYLTSLTDGSLVRSIPNAAESEFFEGTALASVGDSLLLGADSGNWYRVSKLDGSVLESGNNGLSMYDLHQAPSRPVPEAGGLTFLFALLNGALFLQSVRTRKPQPVVRTDSDRFHAMKTHRIWLTLLLLAGLLHGAAPVSAQSSATIVKRLTELETQFGSLAARVSALESENSAKTAKLDAQAAEIANLKARLATVEGALGTQADTVAALRRDLTKEIQDRAAGDGSVSQALGQQLASADANTLATAKSYAEGLVSPLSTKLVHFSRNGNEVYITGANVHIRSGTGTTYGSVNGLGNLTIGYNEGRTGGGVDVRTGSHNLILGFGNNYSAAGGIVNGGYNSSGGQFASVLGGTGNSASGYYSVISGGYNNVATGNWSTIGGGRDKIAGAELSHVP